MTSSRLATALLLAAATRAASAGESYSVGSTGNLYYEYHFDIPAARGRYQPDLMLRYGGPQGSIGSSGATWAVPTVPRITYDYVDINPPFDYQLVFRYEDQRNPTRLLIPSPRVSGAFPTAGSGTAQPWAPDVQDEYMDFWPYDATSTTDTAQTWCARDGVGNIYRFEGGTTTWGGGQKYGSWKLTQVVDPDGNVTKYSYAPLGSGEAVSSIQYNVYGTQPAPPTDCRALTDLQFATELAVEISNGLIRNVRIKNQAAQGQVTVRRYAFTYTQLTWTWHYNQYPWSADFTIDLLQSVTEYGGENGVARPPMAFEYAQMGNDQDPLVKQAHLTKVTTALGAQRAISWMDASQFGYSTSDSYPVVRTITTSGPGLATQSVNYGYAGAPYPGAHYIVLTYHVPDSSSFAESFAIDTTSGIVKHTWWETASHPFNGKEARIEYGTQTQADSFPNFTSYTPPTYALFQTIAFQNVSRTITAAGATGPCTAPGNFATGPAADKYPVLTFRHNEQQKRLVGSYELISQRSVECADVDTWGNVGKVFVDADYSSAGDEYFENTTFEVAFGTSAGLICKGCVREKTKTDPSNGSRLEATYHAYGTTAQVTDLYRQKEPGVPTPGGAAYPLVTHWGLNSNGTVASRREGAITTSYGYDTYQLRPTAVSVADANSTLVTTTIYDDCGRPYSVTGPVMSGRSDPAVVKYFTYDALGRTRIVSQQAMSGSLVQAAVQAFEYAEFSGATPASTKTYDFAVPTNYTDPSVPQTSDVRQTTSWVDGLGREIQGRERLGGTGSGAAGAGITQNLSQYRVTKGIVYDGAGRVTASVEPYFSASGAYKDLRASLDANAYQAVRVNLSSYDTQGRVTCSITRSWCTTSSTSCTSPMPAIGNCNSSFTENSSYARATRLSYRGVVDGGATPCTPGANCRLAVKTIPPENSESSGSLVGPESLFDASGLLRKTTDADGNVTRLSYDRLGRQVKVSRDMTSSYSGSLSPSGRPTTVDTTFSLDLMGRTTQRTDLNMGRRTFVFDDTVSSTLPVTMTFDKTGDEVRYAYDKGRIKTTELCKKTGGSVTCPLIPDSTLVYDVPYDDPLNPNPPSQMYPYTAGRVAWASNQNGIIAFGYDQNGSVARRDQWVPGIAGGFGSLETPRLDAQSIASGLTTPFSSSSYATNYDSASRPVKLSNGGTTYWATTGTAPTGSYDPLGQILSAALDVNRVNQAWTYGSSSALLSAESVRFGTAGAYVYLVNGMTYRGTKLSGFTDSTKSPSTTTYGYWYSNTGRLVAARATASGASPPAPSTLACLTYSATKAYGPGPSLGNIEWTREGVSSPFTSDFAYTGKDVEGTNGLPVPGPDAPASVGATSLAYDVFGRIVSTGGGTATFGYDLLGRMTSITQGGTTEKLYYDPFGALVQRQVGTTVISYVGRRATVTGTLASGCQTPSCGVVVSAVDFHVTLGAGRRIASVRVYGAARTLYYYRDRLGSVVATTRGGGLTGASYRYSANGALEVALSDSGDSASEIGFAGSLRLSGGLLSMGARVYNPALKIWMQPDPLQPFKYDYADGDPVNRIDPSGLATVQLGISMNGTLLGLSGQFSFGIASDGRNFGLYWTYGIGAGIGVGGSAGATLQMSNATDISQLKGYFLNGSVGGGWGPDATGDAFAGKASNGAFVLGGGLTLGAGAGAGASIGVTNTKIPLSISVASSSNTSVAQNAANTGPSAANADTSAAFQTSLKDVTSITIQGDQVKFKLDDGSELSFKRGSDGAWTLASSDTPAQSSQ